MSIETVAQLSPAWGAMCEGDSVSDLPDERGWGWAVRQLHGETVPNTPELAPEGQEGKPTNKNASELCS